MDFDASTPTYAHDANGNLVGDGVFSYAYDTANQLTNVVRTADGARVLSARYDALGQRVEAIRGDGSVERYVYFPGSFLVLAVLDGTNAVKEIYTHGADLSGEVGGSAGGIGGILASTQAGNATFYAYDFNGNIVGATSSNQSVLATLTYTPFGEVLVRTGPFTPRYQFSTKEYSPHTGLNYYGYRYYSPNLGRWMSRDPIAETSFYLLGHLYIQNGVEYVYVRNLPNCSVDALGLMASFGAGHKECCEAHWKSDAEICGEGCTIAKNRYKTAAAASICYKGRACVCVWPDRIGETVSEDVIQCEYVHENEHMKRQTESCPPCNPNAPRLVHGINAPKDECPSYRAQLKCLLNVPVQKREKTWHLTVERVREQIKAKNCQ